MTTDDGYGGMIPALDPYPAADVLLDAERDASACGNCGAPEPARLGDGGCSDCREYPRCYVCRRWVHESWPYVRVCFVGVEGVQNVCDHCMERADTGESLEEVLA